MNTRKQVLLMSGLLLVVLMVLGVYAAWYPYRATDAAVEFDESTAERGAIIFARNCRLCHGDVGEGGALGARLPAAPALDRGDLQGFADSGATLDGDIDATTTSIKVKDPSKLKNGMILIEDEWMDLVRIDGNNLTVRRAADHAESLSHSSGASVLLRDKDLIKDKVKLITNTIPCGRVGTPMPAWAQSQGGPLSDEQIRQLMTVITQNRWDLVKEEVDSEDKLAAHLTQPMDDSTISMYVDDVSVFNEKDAIRMGEERLRITGVPKLTRDKAGKLPKDKSGILQVQRGVLGTTPLEHETSEIIYKFPEVATPSINQASCGQTAQAPAPAGKPALVENFTGQSVEETAANIAFNNKTITVKTGGDIRVRLTNNDAGTQHNIAFYKSKTDLTPVASGSVGLKFEGVAQNDTVFTIPAAGTYYFRCDVHPTIPAMEGTFTVTN